MKIEQFTKQPKMNTALLQSHSQPRQHFGQIDLYTYGDPEFKPVLIDHMINSLLELQQSLYVATKEHNPSVFLAATHKAKTTLGILGNNELSAIVAELEGPTDRLKRIAIFDTLCAEVIRCLHEDKNGMKTQLTINRRD
jgi:hypothetical protein